MELKVLLWSDLHLHNWMQCSNLINGVNDRLLDGINIVKKIIRLSKDYHAVIFAGDLFHKRGELMTIILHLLCEELDTIPEESLNKFFWMIGNHDQDPNTDFHALKFLSKYGTVIDKPGIYHIPHIPWKSTNTYCFSAHPWDDNRMRWRDGYINVVGKNQSKIDFSIAHTDFRDVRYRGKEIGEAPSSDLVSSDIPLYSGHYHDHIVHNTVTYIGSPMQHNWGDTKRARGYVTLQISGESKPRDRTITAQHHTLKIAPRFIEINCIERLEAILKLPLIYFVRVDSTQMTEREKEKIKTMYKKSDQIRSLTFTEEVPYVDEEEEVIPAFNESPDLSDTLQKFVDAASTDLNKKKLLKVGMELMQNAQ